MPPEVDLGETEKLDVTDAVAKHFHCDVVSLRALQPERPHIGFADGRRVALLLLGGQFVASVIWQAVIFGPGRLLVAALWLTLVLVLVVASTVAAFRVDRVAGVLIAPTIAWVSVATGLGWTLYQLNPGA
jgi:tryptophan-rich sensory protein